jgi:cell wall-associated NlpC family hydrolase
MSDGTSSRSAAGVVAAGVAGIALSVLLLFVTVIGGVTGAQDAGLDLSLTGMILQAEQACIVSGPVTGLDPQQAANAEQIVAAAFADSGENTQVAQIALMVADTESHLQSLGPETGNDGSLGLFQQRVSQGWGTAAEELDPAEATAMFVQRLLALPSWSTLAPWVAAQDVQHSAFDGAPSPTNGGSTVVGGNYQANWEFAGLLLAVVAADGNTPGSCGQGVSGGLAGPASSDGRPAGYSIPAGTGPAHTKAVAYALAQLGKPYVWGAAGPTIFDCSGLTEAAWASAGVHLLHYTGDQQQEGQPVTATQLMAGDLVLTPGSDPPGPGVAGHVGIYLGDGLVESAIDPQMGVAVQTWQAFVSGGLIALRDPDPADG